MTMHQPIHHDFTATLRATKMQWFALITVPRGEFRADAELGQAGIVRFTPSFKQRTLIRHTKGRVKTIDQPLMTGYVFAQLDFSPMSHHPSLLAKCKHVVGPVGVQGQPAPIIGDGLSCLAQLKLRCEAGAFDQGKRRGQDNRFHDGDMVRITSGPLSGLYVTFRETADGTLRPRAGHVKVMLNRMFGSPGMLVDIEQELVEAA